MATLIGQVIIGRYRIDQLIGRGGMAAVFRAHDTRLEREVAVKIIRSDVISLAERENILQRFEREGKALAKFLHPNIVPIIDYGEHNDAPFLVMAYLAGGTLRQRIGAPMSFVTAAKIISPIARAVEYAHRRDVLHRDIKPGNILFTEESIPMLSDFGIAKILGTNESTQLTGTGIGIGTPEYMAPEQWQGESSPQLDIYSLGVVFYELVTGKKPYTANTPAAVLLKQMMEPLPLPRCHVADLPEEVEEVICTALRRDPKERFPSMSVFAGELERLSRLPDTTATAPGKKQGDGSTFLRVDVESAPAVIPPAPAAVQPQEKKEKPTPPPPVTSTDFTPTMTPPKPLLDPTVRERLAQTPREPLRSKPVTPIPISPIPIAQKPAAAVVQPAAAAQSTAAPKPLAGGDVGAVKMQAPAAPLKKRLRGWMLVLLGLIVLCVVAVGSVSAFYLLKKTPTPTPTTQAGTSTVEKKTSTPRATTQAAPTSEASVPISSSTPSVTPTRSATPSATRTATETATLILSTSPTPTPTLTPTSTAVYRPPTFTPTPTPKPKTPKPTTGGVTGRVLVGGKPHSGHKVKLSSYQDTTGSDGVYRFNNITPGSHTLTILDSNGAECYAKTVTVTAGKVTPVADTSCPN